MRDPGVGTMRRRVDFRSIATSAERRCRECNFLLRSILSRVFQMHDMFLVDCSCTRMLQSHVYSKLPSPAGAILESSRKLSKLAIGSAIYVSATLFEKRRVTMFNTTEVNFRRMTNETRNAIKRPISPRRSDFTVTSSASSSTPVDINCQL